MSSTRSTAKSEAHARKGHRPEPTPPKQKDARARKREALERFVDKNSDVLAELAK
jgi:hypothetical protein